jgi:hypothetical protein
VQDAGRVDVFETFEDLIDKELEMRVGEFLRRADNLVEIRIHEFVNDIDVVAALGDGGAEDVNHADNVLLPVEKEFRKRRGVRKAVLLVFYVSNMFSI